MKRAAVIFGIHGDEKGPLEVARAARQLKIDSCKVDVIGPVNERAWHDNVRFIDKDLNRSFDGSAIGSESKYVSIVDSLLSYDVVIDIHSFMMDSLLTSVNFQGSKYASSLPLDIVWDVESDEQEYQTTLSAQLHKRGVDSLTIELPVLPCLTHRHVKRVIRAIETFLQEYPQVPQAPIIPHYKRIHLTSDWRGIYHPQAGLGEYVKKGDTIATINRVTEEDIVFKAPTSGTVIQVRPKSWVEPGKSLVAIGKLK